MNKENSKYPVIKRNEHGNIIYREESDGSWYKQEYDKNNNRVYFENSKEYWEKFEYDKDNNVVYFEDSLGHIEDRAKEFENIRDENVIDSETVYELNNSIEDKFYTTNIRANKNLKRISKILDLSLQLNESVMELGKNNDVTYFNKRVEALYDEFNKII